MREGASGSERGVAGCAGPSAEFFSSLQNSIEFQRTLLEAVHVVGAGIGV